MGVGVGTIICFLMLFLAIFALIVYRLKKGQSLVTSLAHFSPFWLAFNLSRRPRLECFIKDLCNMNRLYLHSHIAIYSPSPPITATSCREFVEWNGSWKVRLVYNYQFGKLDKYIYAIS